MQKDQNLDVSANSRTELKPLKALFFGYRGLKHAKNQN